MNHLDEKELSNQITKIIDLVFKSISGYLENNDEAITAEAVTIALLQISASFAAQNELSKEMFIDICELAFDRAFSFEESIDDESVDFLTFLSKQNKDLPN